MLDEDFAAGGARALLHRADTDVLSASQALGAFGHPRAAEILVEARDTLGDDVPSGQEDYR